MVLSSGTEILSPHGMPLDLLDRIMIIKLAPYGVEDMAKILKLRAEVEGIVTDEESIHHLAQIGASTTLRYLLWLCCWMQRVSWLLVIDMPFNC
jgi:DNA helicase TIP49 (TBP-interacting protein)